ncbi:MAG TPA: M14 family metallopeptidase [Steroidobacteraceae bacterium]|jgi:hypothetical protein|nr:M14 family metallopeptidase [Steroidobacteraceae bacterium]
MPVADYFSPDYIAARERFRTSAQAAGASLESHELPNHRGARDEALTMDVARLGASDPASALIIISGTHGVEGFGGSGCQVGFFVDRLYDALPANACALLIHAFNPYGFSWLRRVNEEGVDLNRNFVDFGSALPSSDAYAPLHDWLVPREWQGAVRQQADLAIQAFIQQHGLRAFQTALTAGQFTHPTGLFYGGTQPSWSARTLAQVLAPLRAVPRIAVLDLHTGLGPTGYGEPIVVPRGTADLERARKWYGTDVRDLSADESVSAQLAGTVADGIAATLGHAEITYVGLEFGTRPMLEVLTALRADHWLHAYGGAAERATRDAIRSQMRDAFYCENPAWQTAVYGRTADFIFRACRALGES